MVWCAISYGAARATPELFKELQSVPDLWDLAGGGGIPFSGVGHDSQQVVAGNGYARVPGYAYFNSYHRELLRGDFLFHTYRGAQGERFGAGDGLFHNRHSGPEGT